MIATDKLLFLHLHKSGGTFVNALLMRCVPGAVQVGYHLPYRHVPPEYLQRPVLGTVRSPLGYYVSWYHFQRGQRTPNILFQLASDGGVLGARATIANLIGLANDPIRLGAFEQAVPDQFVGFGLNLTKSCVRELRDSGLGFYSFLHQRLYSGAPNPTIVPMERLREGLRDALAELDVLPNSCAERFLSEVPALNVSRHDPPETYLDPELQDLIRERDGTVLERYDYQY